MTLSAPEMQTPAIKLDQLDAKIETIVAAARRRNFFTVLLAIISTLLIGGWLYYAHRQFATQVTPDLAATFGEKYLQEYLPTASEQAEVSLKEQAPSVVGEGEKQLKAFPAQMEAQFHERARREMDARTPELEDRLLLTLKSGLAEARSKAEQGEGKDDESRFRVMLEMLADTYGKETIKTANEYHAQYARASGDVIGGLAALAEAKSLTPEQTRQRNLVRDFLILAKESDVPAAVQ